MEKRNISGVYFRAKNNSGEWDSIVFEDLNEEKQDEILTDRSEEWLKEMVKILANRLREIGDKFDLIAE